MPNRRSELIVPIKSRPVARCKLLILALSLALCMASVCSGYSVLSHEALIDAVWDPAIRPLLLERFPNSTPDELKTAHSYAYGGAVMQDMGYYPFGSKLFSDLVHYVRSGDFIEALLKDAQDVNEYAFALGALAHYAADNAGHNIATNRVVPMLYPKLKMKYGDVVTYDENPAAHLKTEFGFDVLQVAKGRYAPDDYRDHIGFQVSKDLLGRAFEDTYCLKLDDIFSNFDLAVGTYRRSVSSIIPKMTKVAWQTKKDEIMKSNPGATHQKFLYHLSRSSYRKNWGRTYQAPSFGERVLALFIQILPKVGPLQALAFKMPTAQGETLFMKSFNQAVQDYGQLSQQQRASGQVNLVNDNFDTGSITGPGEYPLADKTYADLLDRLAKDHFSGLTPELQSTVLTYYDDPNAPAAMKRVKKQWADVQKELDELKRPAIAQIGP
jgi:hypothetical protein